MSRLLGRKPTLSATAEMSRWMLVVRATQAAAPQAAWWAPIMAAGGPFTSEESLSSPDVVHNRVSTSLGREYDIYE